MAQLKAPSVCATVFSKRQVDSSYSTVDNIAKYSFNKRLLEAKHHAMVELSAIDLGDQFAETICCLAKHVQSVAVKLKAFASRSTVSPADCHDVDRMMANSSSTADRCLSRFGDRCGYLSLPSHTKVFDNELLDVLLANAAFKLKYGTDQ